MRESVKAEEDLVAVLRSAKNRPSPIDGYFGAVYCYIGPIFTAFRGTPQAIQYLPRAAQRGSSSASAWARARSRPTATWAGEVPPGRRGPPNWTSFRDFWKMFRRGRGGRVVHLRQVGGSTTSASATTRDHPLESLAEYCAGLHTT